VEELSLVQLLELLLELLLLVVLLTGTLEEEEQPMNKFQCKEKI